MDAGLAGRGSMASTVWVCVDTSKSAGDDGYFQVFVSADAAEAWMAEHAIDGFAVECPVLDDAGQSTVICKP